MHAIMLQQIFHGLPVLRRAETPLRAASSTAHGPVEPRPRGHHATPRGHQLNVQAREPPGLPRGNSPSSSLTVD